MSNRLATIIAYLTMLAVPRATSSWLVSMTYYMSSMSDMHNVAQVRYVVFAGERFGDGDAFEIANKSDNHCANNEVLLVKLVSDHHHRQSDE